MELPDDVFETLLHRAHTGQYVNSVAHDLNNLVGASMAYAELIEMDTTDPEIKRMVGEIISAAEKSAELIDAVTAIARPLRIDQDGAASVHALFNALKLLYMYNCKLSQVDMSFTVASDIGRIAMEQHMAQRIVMRIIDNAMEAVKQATPKQVNISAERRDGTVRIVVQDSGPGVAQDAADSLFEPRYTTKDGHLGMGLSTARALAERCNATVDYEPGAGFVLTARHIADE